MSLKKASQLSEIQQSCDPRPLRREELEEFFVDTSAARDPIVSRRDELHRLLTRQHDRSASILLAGHTGCGKSTELVKLSEELSDEFMTVSFSIAMEASLFHVPVEDVLVITMERLLAQCKAEGLADELGNAQDTLREIYRWFAEELQIQESETMAGGEAEAGLDTSGALLGNLLGLLGKAKAFIKRADKRVHRMSQEKPHRLSALAERCNLLIKDIQTALGNKKRRLLIVIEDLDKIGLQDARDIFLKQPSVLAELGCCLICTIPIFLLHSPDRPAVEQHFNVVELPMLRVLQQHGGEPDPAGFETVKQIIGRRLSDELIEEQAREMLIVKTGGVLRDVFEVLVVAAGAAESLHGRGQQEPMITEANIRYGLNRRRIEYKRSISTIDLPPDWRISAKDLWDRLAALKGRSVVNLEAEPAHMLLLKARAILEYNGLGWYRLHPLVEELLEFE